MSNPLSGDALLARLDQVQAGDEPILRADEYPTQAEVERLEREMRREMDNVASRAKSFDALSASDKGRFDKAEQRVVMLHRLLELGFVRRDTSRMPAAFRDDRGVDQSAVDFNEALHALAYGEIRNIDTDLPGYLLANREINRDGSVSYPEVRDLLTSTGTQSMYEGFARTVVEKQVQSAAILQTNATVIQNTGEAYTWPIWSPGSATAASEGSSIGTAEPTPSELRLTSYKAASLSFVSAEILMDHPAGDAGLERALASSMAKGLTAHVAPWITTGTGTDEPQGAFGYTSWSGNADAGTAADYIPTADELIDLVHGLNAVERGPGASFVMNSTTKAGIAKLEDGGGNRLYLPSLAAGVPGTLLGFPVYDDSYVPAAGSAVQSILFGNWEEAFAIRYNGPTRIDRSDHYRFNEDVISFRISQRVDSGVLRADALASFDGLNG